MSVETAGGLFQPYAQSSARIIPSAFHTINFPHAASPLTSGEDYIFGGSKNAQTVTSAKSSPSPIVYGNLGLLSPAASTSNPFTSTPTSSNKLTSSTTARPAVFTGVRERTKLPGVVPLPVVITSACLTFIRSEMYRHDQHSVIGVVTQFFSFDELKHARKTLFERDDPSKKHPYRGAPDTASNKEKAGHCAASIIQKFNELENKGSSVVVACAAEDLYRLTQIHNSASFTIEQRILQLERDMKEVKSAAAAAPATSTLPIHRQPPPSYAASSNRVALLNDVTKNIPFSRPRTPSVKRNRSTSDENVDWETAQHRRNGERPQSKKSRQAYWGSDANTQAASELTGVDIFEVFLCNYQNIATNAVVREHFKDKHKISVISVRERSRPDADIKSFVMRLAKSEDFEKVIKVLPFKTGARWYQRGMNQEKKPLIFNNTSSSSEFILRRPNNVETPHSTPAQRLEAARSVTAVSTAPAASASEPLSMPQFSVGGACSLSTLNNVVDAEIVSETTAYNG